MPQTYPVTLSDVRNPDQYNSERVTIRYGGRDRTFVVVTPDDLPADAPVLLYFHGSLQSGNVARNFTGRTFDDMAAARGVRLVYPDGVDRHFNDTRLALREKTRLLGVDDVGFTRAIADRLGVESVHACGYSNGGQMVMRLLHDAPDLLAGAATFAAPMPAANNRVPGLGTDLVPTPYLALHGTADDIVQYDGGVAGLDPAHTRGELISARASAEYFAQTNGLGPETHTRYSPLDGVSVDSWSGEAPVELWSFEGMGHVVPAVAADVVADFFGF